MIHHINDSKQNHQTNVDVLNRLLDICKQVARSFYPPNTSLPREIYMQIRQDIAGSLGCHVELDVSDPVITLDDCERVIKHVFFALGYSRDREFIVASEQCEALAKIVVLTMDNKSTEHLRHMEFAGAFRWRKGWFNE